MRFINFIQATSCLVLLVSCNSENEPFYAKYDGYDVRLAPVIDPYFIASTSGVDGSWHLDNGKGGNQITHLATVDSLIVSFYFDEYIVIPSKRDTSWHITNAKTNDRSSYSSKSNFEQHLVQLTSNNIEFKSAKEFYQDFLKKATGQ